jgi:vacuolar-type H+-ATPase subunit I/STV1
VEQLKKELPSIHVLDQLSKKAILKHILDGLVWLLIEPGYGVFISGKMIPYLTHTATFFLNFILF